MDRFEKMGITMEAACAIEPAMEIAITPSGRKYKKLLKEKRVEEIIEAFFKAIESAGVQIDKSGAAAEKLGKLARNRSTPTYMKSSVATTYVAGEKMDTTTIAGVPVAMRGSSGYIDRLFWFCIKKKNGKPKVVKFTVNTLAKLYTDDLSRIDPERIKTYAKNLLKYMEDDNSPD